MMEELAAISEGSRIGWLHVLYQACEDATALAYRNPNDPNFYRFQSDGLKPFHPGKWFYSKEFTDICDEMDYEPDWIRRLCFRRIAKFMPEADEVENTQRYRRGKKIGETWRCKRTGWAGKRKRIEACEEERG